MPSRDPTRIVYSVLNCLFYFTARNEYVYYADRRRSVENGSNEKFSSANGGRYRQYYRSRSIEPISPTRYFDSVKMLSDSEFCWTKWNSLRLPTGNGHHLPSRPHNGFRANLVLILIYRNIPGNTGTVQVVASPILRSKVKS